MSGPARSPVRTGGRTRQVARTGGTAGGRAPIKNQRTGSGKYAGTQTHGQRLGTLEFLSDLCAAEAAFTASQFLDDALDAGPERIDETVGAVGEKVQHGVAGTAGRGYPETF